MTYLPKLIFSRLPSRVSCLLRDEIRHPSISNSLYYANPLLSRDCVWYSGRSLCDSRMGGKIPTKEELKKLLTPLQYHVTQEKGTERPFTGKYDKTTDAGTYVCIVCREPLFSSDTKYDAGCGWPAFNDVLDKGLVKLSKDMSTVGGNILLLVTRPGLMRTEVQCSKCDAHLGHVFDDGPPPTRKRFCINSASIDFIEAGQKS